MRVRLFFGVSILVATISLAIVGQQPVPAESASVELLQKHVSYLASDALDGRRTGTEGANSAATYIAGEFSRLGLRPPAQTASRPKLTRYEQPFPYVAGVELGKKNSLSLSNAATLRVGEDWMPLGLAANGVVDGTSAVFVGFGITAAELNYDDYKGTITNGKVAIALEGTPDGDNPHGQFGRYEDPRWKAIAARTAGAKALLLIAKEDNFKDDRLARLQYDNTSGDSGLPVAVISRQAAQQFFARSSLSDLEQAAKTRDIQALQNITSPGQITASIEVIRKEAPASNVVGILNGSDPSLRNEFIVVGAHYDHLGRGGAGSLAPRAGEIHHGADDNASGVAGVLELARLLSTQKHKLRRSVVFVAFSGEEEGLLGSNFYVNHPVVPLANTVAMINLDMVGRVRNKNLIIGGVGTAQEWRSIIDGANVDYGSMVSKNSPVKYPIVTGTNGEPVVVANSKGQTNVSVETAKLFQLVLTEDGFGPSDHSSFYAKQIPVLFFWSGTHEDYHKPSDTADKINYADEANIVGLVTRIIRNIDDDKRPTYKVAKTESTGRSTGFRVYLGTIPNYADSNDGLLLDGVRDDSPAAKAGLKAGDRIVRLAGRDVKNVYDYTYALGEMKAGEEYEVDVVRGSERLKLKLTPAARR
jgi:Zn-dependent M28 family amino/carboxypeptidase